MRFQSLLILSLVGLFSTSAMATRNLDEINNMGQNDFRDLSGDLGAIVSYKAVMPLASLGISGFEFGANITASKIEHRDAWNRGSSGTGPSIVYVPKVFVHKGLPAGFDIGAFYSSVLDTNINIWGAEVRYALIPGGVTTPAVGLRGAYTKLSDVDHLDLNTKSIDIGISKGFTIVTPYAGVGRVWTVANPIGTTLSQEKHSDTKLYAGASFKLLPGVLALEADKTGDVTSYSIKVGIHF